MNFNVDNHINVDPNEINIDYVDPNEINIDYESEFDTVEEIEEIEEPISNDVDTVLEYIDVDFVNWLDGRSILQLFLSSTRLQDLFCLDCKLVIEMGKKGIDYYQNSMKNGFSSWIISSINESVSGELSELLWEIFNDLFKIFKTFVMKTTLSSNSFDLNTLVDNYCKGMFVTKVLKILNKSLKISHSNSLNSPLTDSLMLEMIPTNNLLIGSIACVVKTIFKKSLRDIYSDVKVQQNKVKSFESSYIEYLSFFGWGLKSLIDRERRKQVQNTTEQSQVISNITF